MEDQIFVSALAIEQIKLQLQKRGTPNACLRLGVQGAGCSGYTYILKYEDSGSQEKDHTFSIDGITILVDKKSLLFLKGCTLDWVQTLIHHGFKFINPNEKSRCGCGSSFSV